MYRLALAPLILILSACSTVVSEPVQVRLPASLTQPCEPLPKLEVEPGADLRPAILENRVESERAHAECAARHQAVVDAVKPTRAQRAERKQR
jgi:hypothetical protein